MPTQPHLTGRLGEDRPATVQDVAHRAKVAVSTAYEAMRGDGRLAKQTRERVIRAAQELGYRPNAAARATRGGQFGAVGLLLSTDVGRSNLPTELLFGIHDALAKHEVQLILSRLPDEELTKEGVVPQLLRQWSADGMLISYTDHIPRKMIDLIEGHRVPSVWMNTKGRVDCVHPDDLAAGRKATELLLNLGHRRIAYVDLSHAERDLGEAHYSAVDRQSGYESAMRAAGLPCAVVRPDRVVGCGKRTLIGRWLAREPRPTAVVTYSVEHLEIVLAVAARFGLQCPRDLSGVMFGRQRETVLGVTTTALREPWTALGHLAVEMLLEKLKSGATERLPAQTVPFEIQQGGTTGPCRTVVR